MQQSDGGIRCESVAGGGTEFTVVFPRVLGVSGPVPATVNPQAMPAGATVLIVDDEEALRALVHRMLERQGYRVMTARSGADALALIRAHPGSRPDLLVTDVVMPGLRGTEVARHATALVPSLRVLFMSGYADDEVLRCGALEPNVGFLKKPFGAGELLAAVGRMLGNRNQRGSRGRSTVEQGEERRPDRPPVHPPVRASGHRARRATCLATPPPSIRFTSRTSNPLCPNAALKSSHET